MNKRTTISDVANYLSINKSTVSRAINNPNRVSKELHARVIQACNKLNYIPNVAAKTLASSSSKSILLVVPSFTNTVFPEIISATKLKCEALGYNLLVGDSEYTELGEEKIVKDFLSRNVDGFIFTETIHSWGTVELIKNSACPAVEIMDIIKEPTFDANFGVDQSEAATELTSYLISKGRKNIAFCSTWLDHRAMLRKEAWSECLQKAGLDNHRVINIKHKTSFQSGADALRQILHSWPETDAVFFVNDDMAAGAIMQCQRHGISVGKELDIVGFNDLDYAAVINPRLTTIRTPRVEMAELAVETLVNLLEGKSVEIVKQKIPYKLIIRESA
ncbi:LacI family DNA-binding transcriptional regulator [Vibrio litoralis]|uniref:LacI family DNA-binding transcriptional regulator n=1 Tax=Vibrio litoralis TaxID=335972 RepID=UPI0003F96C15|nr:LacI family DNA-binding transcriptional regulator [Vibrio litoralis]